MKQRKEKERRKATATSSKLLWHLQNLCGDVCTAILFVFHPPLIIASCFSRSVLFKKRCWANVPLATAGLPASCTLFEILEKMLQRVELRFQCYLLHWYALVSKTLKLRVKRTEISMGISAGDNNHDGRLLFCIPQH